MVAKHVNKNNAGKPRVLVINALLHSLATLSATFRAMAFNCYLWWWCKATVKVNFLRIWCITNPAPARRVTVTPPSLVRSGLADRVTCLGGSPHLSCKIVNVIKSKWEIVERFHTTSRRPYWCSKTIKRRPCWCTKTTLWQLNSFLM